MDIADRQLLGDVIDWWLEGNKDAKNLTIEDVTVETPEQLLTLMASYDEDTARLQRIREQL